MGREKREGGETTPFQNRHQPQKKNKTLQKVNQHTERESLGHSRAKLLSGKIPKSIADLFSRRLNPAKRHKVSGGATIQERATLYNHLCLSPKRSGLYIYMLFFFYPLILNFGFSLSVCAPKLGLRF